MKNITFSLDENLIRRAREKARREHRSLNKLLKEWLTEWTRENKRGKDYDVLMERLRNSCEAGKSFSRDEMNER
ncbi:MAG TPA: ribbon-helix-helix protein, CopG family [Clostridia bacterium]|nr:ribbon-helix-helix protein, CopG family [Clostridia bacterium]